VPALAAAPPAELQSAALLWWERHGRSLNFRRNRDPYAVLVSEVIAQQTQIARVEPAWEAFMARFPTVAALAAASPADVLRQWQGLGYNRRALNLQRAAQAVVVEHGGAFPASVDALAALPGIGPYTARAVAAIAFGLPVGAVDTNVRRVLGRAVWGQAEAAAGPALQALADQVVPPGRAGEWTHALMDIGALFCRPRAPRCDGCPLTGACRFRATGAVVDAFGPRARPPERFEATMRWLRGRLLDAARATPDDGWFAAEGPIGMHAPAAVATAVTALAAEGLLERDPTDPRRVRLPR
jgi:A/G-specific adenine glycosylase